MNRWIRWAAVLGLAAAATVANADVTYRLIVPTGPGTGNDVIFRNFAPHLAAELGGTVVVENRPGADGAIAVNELRRSPNDGRTLLAVTDNMITMNHLITSYDPKAIKPLVWIMRTSAVLVTSPDSKYKTIDDMLVAARTNPESVSIGIAAGVYRFNLALMEKATNTRFKEVPYAGTAATLYTDLMAGRLDATLLEVGGALPQIQGGRVRPLAVLGPERAAVLPNVPTIGTSVYPSNYSMTLMFGLAVVNTTPDGPAKELTAAIQRAARKKPTQDFITSRGQSFYGATGEEAGPALEKITAQFKELVEKTDILKRAKQ